MRGIRVVVPYPGCTSLNVVHLCACLFCKHRLLMCGRCRECVCHASALKGCLVYGFN